MFRAAEAENNRFTWIFRLIGFVLMSVGIGMVLRPLAVRRRHPLIGNVIRLGTGFVAVGTGLVLSLVTIALGWVRSAADRAGDPGGRGAGAFGFLRLARNRRRPDPNRQPKFGSA